MISSHSPSRTDSQETPSPWLTESKSPGHCGDTCLKEGLYPLSQDAWEKQEFIRMSIQYMLQHPAFQLLLAFLLVTNAITIALRTNSFLDQVKPNLCSLGLDGGWGQALPLWAPHTMIVGHQGSVQSDLLRMCRSGRLCDAGDSGAQNKESIGSVEGQGKSHGK